MRIIDRFDEYMTFKHLNDNRATKDLGFFNWNDWKIKK